jgi:sugar/nucleoside kinase (ribokinase family)
VLDDNELLQRVGKAFVGRAKGDRPAVVIAGSVTRDLIHRGGGTVARIGGTVWYAGLTLARLGFPTRIVTRLGAGESGIRIALAEAGLEARIEPSTTSTVFHNSYGDGGPDDRVQAVETVAEPISAQALSAALGNAALCYLGPLHPGDLSAAVASRLDGFPIALDVQGYTRRIDHGRVLAEVAPALTPLLASAKIIKASAAEACLIAETADPAEAARRLAGGREDVEILVTCGGDGVHMVAGGEPHHLGAVPLGDVDPTGAGDIFLAAYLAGRLIGETAFDAAGLAARHAALCLKGSTHANTKLH